MGTSLTQIEFEDFIHFPQNRINCGKFIKNLSFGDDFFFKRPIVVVLNFNIEVIDFAHEMVKKFGAYFFEFTFRRI